MNTRAVVIGVALIIVVTAGAFALLPFEAAEHRTNVEGSTGTAVVGNASAELEGPIAVYVEGPGWSAGAVSHFVVGGLRDAGYTADQTETLADHDGPILAVRILDLDAAYRPVSPTGTVEWRFVYATSGNASFVRDQLSTEHGPVVVSDRERFVVEGEFKLQDDVRGVVSVPAYRSGLAERVGSTTVERLRAATE